MSALPGKILSTAGACAILLSAAVAGDENKAASADDPDALIAEALSAAPAAIAEIATVKNWDGSTLKPGSEEWVCYPSMPDREGVCPMCLDKPWQTWFAAMMAGEAPEIKTLGISYMLRGDCAVSNIDPTAMSETPDNQWIQEGPHVMLLGPEGSYEGYTEDPYSGEPYLMWGDTPYAHIMAPLPDAEEE
jgi:hypothetical protein